MLPSTEKIESRRQIASTKEYYDRNAHRYFESTVGVDMSAVYDRFLSYVPAGGRILDAGSGSGRDTVVFLKRGYVVEAFDVSSSLAALSTELTGVRTEVKSFEDLEETERYDGIWACASLLHVSESGLPGIMVRLARALKRGGALYVSFKQGRGERVLADGRRFTDLDEPALRGLIQSCNGLVLKEIWVSRGEDKFKGRGGWINAVAVKDEA